MDRPNPDTLLTRVQAEEGTQRRARLKIFFGAAPGVGKTYAMLSEARDRRAAGTDVVVGVAETHGRSETAALLDGLDILPQRELAYRGVVLREFDLDAALARRPALILVDELAHTNADGSRHPKRWQDVIELLDAGIDVYTTINVQHLESLNDVVAQITGVIVRETVPDHVLERADEIELVDVPPEELAQRLRDGKVYVGDAAQRAGQHFFRKGNLIALRELALRRTAEQVDAQMQSYRRDHAIGTVWPTSERILVCVGPGPLGPRLVRAARRHAMGLRAAWIVAYVETPASLRLTETEREEVFQTLRLAEQLGAETVTLSGQRVSDEIVSYARTRNVVRIVVGKPDTPRWREIVFGSVVDSLIRDSDAIDVYIINGDADPERRSASLVQRHSDPPAYLQAVGIVMVATAVCWAAFPYFAVSNLILFYELGIIAVALRGGRGPSAVASLLSVVAFDFFFVAPYFSFAVSDSQYLVTFGIMLIVALIISTLTIQLRQQADAARQRERYTAALYAMSRELTDVVNDAQLLGVAVRTISTTLDATVVVLLPDTHQRLQAWGNLTGWWGEGITNQMLFAPDAKDHGVAQWVYEHGQSAGRGADTLPSATALYVPLETAHGVGGVLGVRPQAVQRTFTPEQRTMLDAFARQIALVHERTRLTQVAQQAQVQVETEQLRNALLSSVSHDLRTPLATITGAASGLLDGEDRIDQSTRRDLYHAIYDEGQRLNRLVNNLLDITRVEAGTIQVCKEWQPLEEVIGSALARVERTFTSHARHITTDLPVDLPLVPLDGVLIEQVLVNVLENALKYAPADAPISISARAVPESVTVAIADRGPGIPIGDEQRIFDKFYRAHPTTSRGVGLGLAICKGMIEAHRGRIWAENRATGGAIIRFTLPIDGAPPLLPTELAQGTSVPDATL